MNIALLSPSQNAYSETFIKAHKNLLKGNILYYYSGNLPTKLEGGNLFNSRRLRISEIIKGHFNLNKFSLSEQALINSFKKNNIKVVLAEYGETAQKIIPVCKELNLPLIVHFHGYDASVFKVIKNNHNYKDVFQFAQYVVVVSKKMYKDILNMGCPENILVYTVYGPDRKFYDVEPKFSKHQLISVGRFVDKKAPYYLILSFLKVIKNFPQAKLVMAGDGPLLNTCKNLVKYYHLEGNINFVGIITPEEFRKYLQESMAFVQHSIIAENGDAEGTPVGVLEASAAGLPIISTRHGGIPDVVIDGKTGFLVDEHDVQGMSYKIIQLLEDKDLAIKMGANGKKNIKQNFSQKKHLDILDELVEKAVFQKKAN